jgi:hypothetical protein
MEGGGGSRRELKEEKVQREKGFGICIFVALPSVHFYRAHTVGFSLQLCLHRHCSRLDGAGYT